MIEEKELLTILTKNQYIKIEKSLKHKFGKPKFKKRISIQSDDYNQEYLDTRIKITNGKAELIQKVGDWKNITEGKSRTEISVPIKNNTKVILSLYKILRNLTQGDNVQNIIMQYENMIWKNKNYEIKLTRQFGKNTAYNCEVEVFNQKLNPIDIANELNIVINPPPNSSEFWKDWNEKVNLNADQISESDLVFLISRYL